MKKLYFKYGVMGSSKSAQALMTAFNYRQKGYNVLLMKPNIDNRDDSEIRTISSRIGLSQVCRVFGRDDNLEDFVDNIGKFDVVIVDEAQFCTAKQIDQLKKLTERDIAVMCYGLKTNFRTELFEGSKRLMEIAESIHEIKCICRCGRKAEYNARIVNGLVVTKGDEIQIGGDESYEAMCYECYHKYQHCPVDK